MSALSEEVLAVNNEAVHTLIPVIVYICLLIVIGLLGNPLVIYFYGIKQKPSPSFMYVISLAVFDLITCAIVMPMELVIVVKFYTFDSPACCKTIRFFSYFSTIASALTLMLISVDRYRKICKPLDYQISSKAAKISLLVIVAFSLLLSAPAAVFYDIIQVNLTKSEDLEGLNCGVPYDVSYKDVIAVYNFSFFILFGCCVIVLILLYSLIGRQLFKMKNSPVRRHSHARTSHQIKTRKYTVVMLLISATFVGSYLPFLALSTMITVSDGSEPDVYSKAKLAAFQIFIRSYFLSSICNPIIYGLMNNDFKIFLVNLFCRCQRDRFDLPAERSTTNTEQTS
ncbi:hypothetical protein FSP39_001559 [Pinctada imbricata]|uniref:G-protein coupled receptors family 1 profile domain-containing protein n=1 Tax=Pinctada imbricata TaxID=66713 RepID=A0AA88Y0Y3_PINIB|nr:hypothetical protein FSP39_001559 [Pinctada imbricata]